MKSVCRTVLITYQDESTQSVLNATDIQFGEACVQVDWEEDGLKQIIVPLANVRDIRVHTFEVRSEA